VARPQAAGGWSDAACGVSHEQQSLHRWHFSHKWSPQASFVQ